MKPTYSDAGKLAWYPDIACPVCGGDVNSWDKRCSRALGYRQIVCEGCISSSGRWAQITARFPNCFIFT